MGIPSYFSYIIKNHPEIINRLDKLGEIDNFYLDSNSVIYDCLRKLSTQYTGDDELFEEKLIMAVADQLNVYIDIVKPTHITYIAFDGVAPVAKLEQQRNRRYKSYLDEHIRMTIDRDFKKGWDRTAITPGTNFMDKLGKFLTNKFKDNSEVMVSPSDEAGEGEHKIFQYIRDQGEHHKETTTLIYGLDADLIMLCLNHLNVCKDIYLYRETPEFIKSIDSNLEPNEHYFLDIPLLSDSIIGEMCGFALAKDTRHNTIYDYIFLTFFLGNDFLPHFPSMNIRTNGMNILLAAYRNTIHSKGLNLTDGRTIFWGNLRIMIKFLADEEQANLREEYKIRNRLEKRSYPCKTVEDKLQKLNNIPTKRREVEKFIDPYTKYWDKRYYSELFGNDIDERFIKGVCINYMSGLEWVMRYYTTGCCDWRWHYRYDYPPTLNDLLSYIPHWDSVMIESNEFVPIEPMTQLAYVLPRKSLGLIPDDIREVLLNKYSDNYPTNCEISWAFCKYFWESHIDLPCVDLDNLIVDTTNVP